MSDARFIVKYKAGHSYTHAYSFDDGMFCPSCGARGIWIESEGDYYVGPTHICLSCETQFHLPIYDSTMDTFTGRQILGALRAEGIDTAADDPAAAVTFEETRDE